ncbi:MAG TPA: hypothetical protein P5242_04410, partial [Sedimentisphaerales bacterium]|nr:hypothetical protein [Sedimentisphaerales bacterium]
MKKGLWAVLVCVCLSAPAWADLTPIYATPTGNGEASLLVSSNSWAPILEHLYGAGNFVRIDDDFDQLWMNLNGGAKAEAKWAAATEGFGYIDGATGGTYHELFEVAQGTNGYLSSYSGTTPGHATLPVFRFALDGHSFGISSSQESDNTGGSDHMVTWRVTNKVNTYVIGWEVENLGDRDYQDLVVEVSNVAPVPVPGAVLLGVLGLSVAG